MSRRPPRTPNEAEAFRATPNTADLWVIVEEVRLGERPTSRAVLTTSNRDRAVMEAKLEELRARQRLEKAGALDDQGRVRSGVQNLHFFLMQVKDLNDIDYECVDEAGG